MTFGRLGILGQMSTLGMSTPAGAVIRIAAPSITSPTDDATDIGETPTITTSAFSVTNDGSDTHASTDWQIASDSDFSTIVVQSLADASNKVSWDVPSGNLSTSTEYFIRVRHNGTTYGASGWSSTVSFTTASAFGYSWTNSEGEAFEAAMSGTYSDAKLALLDTYISNLKSGLTNGTNTWGGHDVLTLLFLDNVTDALRWFNSPSTLMTAVNSPTHTPGDGYSFNGSTNYIDTEFSAATDGVQWTQNSACMMAWATDLGDLSGAGVIAASVQAQIRKGISGEGAGADAYSTLPNSSGSISGFTNAEMVAGLISINRSGASAGEAYVNGSLVASDTDSAGSLYTPNIWIGAGNNGSGGFGFSDAEVAIFHAGRSFTANEQADIYAADNALLTAWAAA